MKCKFVGMLLITLVIFSASAVAQPTMPVTFRVNMSQQVELGNFNPETDFAVVTGQFNYENPNNGILSYNEEGYYEGTFDLRMFSSQMYRFGIYNQETALFVQEEMAPRMVQVQDSPIELPVVWYGGDQPPTEVDVLVTFRLDMNEQLATGEFDPETDVLIVRGGREELGMWTGSDIVLEEEEGTVFMASLLFEGYPAGESTLYKYVVLDNGSPDSPIWENDPNRSFTVTGEEPDGDDDGVLELDLPVAEFNDHAPEQVPVTFRVQMSYQEELGLFDPENDQVVLLGTFNGYVPGANTLEYNLELDVYETTLYFTPGYIGRYRFGFMGALGEFDQEMEVDRSFIAEGGPVVLPTEWYNNQSGGGGSEYQDTYVAFMVNMNVATSMGLFDPETDQIVLCGEGEELGRWGETYDHQLTLFYDEEMIDFHYGVAVLFEEFPIGASREYTFVILPEGSTEQAIWETCGNRSFVIDGTEPDEDEDGIHERYLPMVLFNDQDAEVVTHSDLTAHFRVDMRPVYYRLNDPEAPPIQSSEGHTVTSIETVGWAGSQNSWPFGGIPEEYLLHDDGIAPDEVAGDSIFSVTVFFPSGSLIGQDYKYAINGFDVEAGVEENHWVNLDDETGLNIFDDIFGSQGSWYDEWIDLLLPGNNYEVYFCVDMTSVIENAPVSLDTMIVGVRGSTQEFGEWEVTYPLVPQEEYPTVYQGWFNLDDLHVGYEVEYKFVVSPVTAEDPWTGILWEDGENRDFRINGAELDQDEDGRFEVLLPLTQFRYTPESEITSIYNIQFVSNPEEGDASPLLGETVTVQGWITFDPASGDGTRFFMADASGAWNGISVYSPTGISRMGVGWEIRVTGVVQEYFGLTELVVNDWSDIEVVNSAIHWNNPPEATLYATVPVDMLQDYATAEQFESVLIRVPFVTTAWEGNGEDGEWGVADADGNGIIIDNPMSETHGYLHTVEMGKPYDHIQGVLNYTYGTWKLLPEIAHDLNVAVDIENGWFDEIPYIQQVKWHDIVVHRGEGVEEYRNDQSYASDSRYDDFDRSEWVTVRGVVMLEPGIGHASEGATKFLIADPGIGVDENNVLRAWSSVMVYAPDASVVPPMSAGDLVIVQGYVTEYVSGPSNMTEIMLTPQTGMVQNLGTSTLLPLPKPIDIGQVWDYWFAEQYETVMVYASGGEVTDNSDLNVKKLFLVEDYEDEAPAVLIAGDSAEFRTGSYTRPEVGTWITGITGWIGNMWGMLTPETEYDNIFHLNPRFESDIEFGGGGEDPYFLPVPETGLPYAVVVASASFGEETLQPGDEIAVFDGELCVGAEVIESFPVSITAWQGDPSQGLEGFIQGHPITFRVWVHGEMMEYPAMATYIQGNGTFGYGVGSNVILDVQLEMSLELVLQGGRYELVSTPLSPANLAVSSFFGVLDGLQIVYSDNGGFYWPDAGVDNIGNIDVTEGYRLFLSSGQTLTINGTPLDPDTQYNLLDNRWNWLGYPFLDGRPVASALSPISEELIIVMNDDGQLYWPDAGVNTLGQLTPGMGYQIFVSDEVAFIYDNSGFAKTAMPLTEITLLPDAPTPTGLPFPVLVSWDEMVDAEGVSAVELYAGDLLVGKGAPLSDRAAALVTAWGGDEAHGLPGFRHGESIRVRLLDESGLEVPLKSETTTARYGEGPGARITVERTLLPTEFNVSNGYPNPFNPSITIPFGLPESGEVTFTLYNLLGQRVAKESMMLKAGYHRHILMARPTMVSGVYFLRVDFGSASKMQKIMLLK